MILQSAGLLAVIHTLFKKIFPSGNFLFSWDRRILLELVSPDATCYTHQSKYSYLPMRLKVLNL